MPKAKITQKSKPTKKTAPRSFHKHVAEESITTSPEPTSQTTQPESEAVIAPIIQPEPETETAPAPDNPQPQPQEEKEIPITAAITPPKEDVSVPSVADDTPTIDTIEPITPTPQEPQQLAPSPIMDENEGKSKKPLIIVVIIVVMAVAIISGYFLYTKKLKTENVKPQPTPISQTSQSPDPSPKAITRTDWILEVLNGSTKKGAAAVLAQKLTEKGYQVIKTGNAPEDVATSQVFFADSTKDQADLFLEDIKEELLNPTNAGNLEDSTASARIIIGED